MRQKFTVIRNGAHRLSLRFGAGYAPTFVESPKKQREDMGPVNLYSLPYSSLGIPLITMIYYLVRDFNMLAFSQSSYIVHNNNVYDF